MKVKNRGYHPELQGVIEFTASKNAWVVLPGRQDIRINNRNVGKALNGDTVSIFTFPGKPGRKSEGKVVKVVKRAKDIYAGTLRDIDGIYMVIPDSPKCPVNFVLQHALIMGTMQPVMGPAKLGEKVLIKIVSWSNNTIAPICQIVSVLGEAGLHETEMKSIMYEFGVDGGEFPDEVIKDVTDAKWEFIEEGERRDFRDTVTFTIDPEDAKDLDDAISIKQIGDNWQIGIHIADVSHFVTPGTALDIEAYKRATSIYLVDRCIPMLPEQLSNGLCSLHPGEDKNCMSAVFTMDANANIIDQWFGKTVINSNRKFSYETAQEAIEGNTEIEFHKEILVLNDLAGKLRSKRREIGSINFKSTEIKFKLDENMKPIGAYIKEQKESNMLIEDFMLLANKKVAEFIGKDNPCVYRVHDAPDPDKLTALAETALTFGHKVDFSTADKVAKSLNKLLLEIDGLPEQGMIESLAIRTMSKAIYTIKNIGHYGLAFEHYSHFTSPIRRYPDLMTHRILTQVLEGKRVSSDGLEVKCVHCSTMERSAAEAERASIKYKQVEFMSDKIGDVFDGVITGVTANGLFIEIIETRCEGMVRSISIGDCSYDERMHQLVCDGDVYRLGDIIPVKVISTNLDKRQIDLVISIKKIL